MSLPTPADAPHNHVGAGIAMITITPLPFDPWGLTFFHLNISTEIRLKMALSMARNAPNLASIDEIFLLLLALDYLFFDGFIFRQSLCQIVIEWTYDWRASALRGQTYLLDDGKIKMEIKANSPSHKTALDVICTIVHEMVHVVIIHILAPMWPPCNDQCYRIQAKLVGESNHGYHWQDLARRVERRAKIFFGPDAEIGRLDGIVTECVETGTKPSRAYYEELFRGEVRKNGKRFAPFAQKWVENWLEGDGESEPKQGGRKRSREGADEDEGAGTHSPSKRARVEG